MVDAMGIARLLDSQQPDNMNNKRPPSALTEEVKENNDPKGGKTKQIFSWHRRAPEAQSDGAQRLVKMLRDAASSSRRDAVKSSPVRSAGKRRKGAPVPDGRLKPCWATHLLAPPIRPSSSILIKPFPGIRCGSASRVPGFVGSSSPLAECGEYSTRNALPVRF